MKKCPYCAEEIQDAAIVCRYCGRDLEPELPSKSDRVCQFCGVVNRDDAFTCRNCGRAIISTEIEQAETTKKKKKKEKKIKTSLWKDAIIVGILCSVLYAGKIISDWASFSTHAHMTNRVFNESAFFTDACMFDLPIVFITSTLLYGLPIAWLRRKMDWGLLLTCVVAFIGLTILISLIMAVAALII